MIVRGKRNKTITLREANENNDTQRKNSNKNIYNGGRKK